jgi:hypothetical protein
VRHTPFVEAADEHVVSVGSFDERASASRAGGSSKSGQGCAPGERSSAYTKDALALRPGGARPDPGRRISTLAGVWGAGGRATANARRGPSVTDSLSPQRRPLSVSISHCAASQRRCRLASGAPVGGLRRPHTVFLLSPGPARTAILHSSRRPDASPQALNDRLEEVLLSLPGSCWAPKLGSVTMPRFAGGTEFCTHAGNVFGKEVGRAGCGYGARSSVSRCF